MPLSTLQTTPRGVARKTRGQDGFATSFPVGLFHPLQHAGLSRRSPDGREPDVDRRGGERVHRRPVLHQECTAKGPAGREGEQVVDGLGVVPPRVR